MIARVKKDLHDLFEYCTHTNYNKFWRKFLGRNRHNYSNVGHGAEICQGLRQIKVCEETIEELSKNYKYSHYSVWKEDTFTSIFSNPQYTKEEQENIIEKYKDKIPWLDIFMHGILHFDLKVKYYQ